MRPRLFLVLAGVVLLARPGGAWDSVVAVSPGSPTGSLIGDTCPTFSWGSVERAHSYELVLYRLGEEGEEEEPVLRQSFAGSVASWTPSLERCLEQGGRYAWSVRAIVGKRTTPWSELALFEVAPEPTEAEVRRALAVVERYVDDAKVEPRSPRVLAAKPVEAPSVGGELRIGESSLPNRLPDWKDSEVVVEGELVAWRLYEACGDARWYYGPCYRSFGVFPGKTWAEVQSYCVSTGSGHLATLTSAEEQAFVLSLYEEFDPAALLSGIWIGYSDARSEGTWEWVTGEPGVSGNDSTYSNWAPGEPNDWGGAEDCAVLQGGNWNDVPCSATFNYYLCERDH